MDLFAHAAPGLRPGLPLRVRSHSLIKTGGLLRRLNRNPRRPILTHNDALKAAVGPYTKGCDTLVTSSHPSNGHATSIESVPEGKTASERSPLSGLNWRPLGYKVAQRLSADVRGCSP